MTILTLDVMALLFLAAAVTSLWRWRYSRFGAALGRCILYAGGAVFYVWLQTTHYDPVVALVGAHAVCGPGFARTAGKRRCHTNETTKMKSTSW